MGYYLKECRREGYEGEKSKENGKWKMGLSDSFKEV